MTPGDAIREALEKLGWSETQLAREAGIDRAAMHKIIDGTIGLGRTRAERIVSAVERGGATISLEVLVQPPQRDIERLLRQAEAVTRKLDQAREQLEAAGREAHQGTDRSQ